MSLEIELPTRVPVMTLPEVAFFPKVMMPLFIFEPRYRTMLKNSLENERMFAVAGIDHAQLEASEDREPSYNIATVGIIRGCRTQEDGTSHLILQGLSRVRLDKIYEEQPYREAAITPLKSTQKVDRMELLEKKSQLLGLVTYLAGTHSQMPAELFQYVEGIEEPEDFVDMVAYTFVQNASLKQTVLETLRIEERFDLLLEALS